MHQFPLPPTPAHVATAEHEPSYMSEPPPPDVPVGRNGAFVTFWLGQAISQVGDAVGGLALPLLVLALTGSALHMGTVIAIIAAPLAVIGIPAGVLVDRLNRRLTMLICDALRAALFVGLAVAAVLNQLDLRALYIAAALLGILQVFFYLAGQTAVPSLVARGRIVQANSWVLAASSASGLLGLPVAGILIADIGPERALAVDGITFVVSAISLAAVRRSFAHPVPLPAPRRPEPHSIVGALGDVLRATLAGVGVIWRTPVLRGATLLSVGLNLLLSLGSATGLFRLKHDLHYSPMLIGFIFAGASAGAVALALAAGPLRRRLGFAHALLLAVAVQAPLALGIGWLTNSVALGVCYAISSGAGSLFSVTTISLRQSITPGALLGRVSAVVQTSAALAITVGTFLGGLLTTAVGASPTFTLMAGGLVLLLAMALLGGVQRLDPRGPAAEPYWSM